MKRSIFNKLALCSLVALAVLQSCHDKKETVTPPAPVPDQSFSQSFDNMADAQAQGWVFKNKSDSTGDGWSVEANTLFYGDVPFDGTNLLYVNLLANTSLPPKRVGNISAWAISPVRIFQNGDKISFYALSNGEVDGYPDRLQLRLNVFNTSDSIGTKSTDVGNFTRPLLDINQSYSVDAGAFPSTWTKYEATIVGLNKPTEGRFAIRYYLEVNGGDYGEEVAIDKVVYTSASHP